MTENKPLLHIATDGHFINVAYEIYENAFPGKNIFIILHPSKHVPIKHLSNELPYIFVSTTELYLEKVLSYTMMSKYIIYHSFTHEMVDIFQTLSRKGFQNIWSVFGYEMHSLPYISQKKLFGLQTYHKYIKDPIKDIKNIFRPIYYRITKNKNDPYLEKMRAFNQMDFVAVLYKEEFEYFKKIGRINNADHIKFTYAPIGIAFKPELNFITSNNILLGNSASYTNNHIEALNILKKLNIDQCEIITPLSYGKKDYATDIVQYGNNLFGENFKPLLEFLPLDKYYSILQKCGVVIMNHYRQQALGNVLYTLYVGAKIYLSDKNTLYHYLKRIGCHIFCIEKDLIPENKSVFKLLTKEQMEENRRILYGELNIDRICNELQNKLPL